MNRRQALQAMAVVPVVLSSVGPPVGSNVTFYGPDEWMAMADRLWSNYLGYVSDKRDWVKPGDEQFLKPICYRFCRSLLGGEGDPHGLTSAFFPDQDPLLIRKNVVFGVTDADRVELGGIVKVAQSRKLRMPRVDFCAVREAIAECPTYHGLDQEYEFVVVSAEELSFDVKREIRMQWRANERVRAYVLRLPPHVGLVSPQFQEGFSVNRGWRLKYTKFYERETT